MHVAQTQLMRHLKRHYGFGMFTSLPVSNMGSAGFCQFLSRNQFDGMASLMEQRPIDPNVGIGHIHLKVADIERSLGFYRDVLGFEVTQRFGRDAAFISAGGYHHHIGLNTSEG